MNRFIAKIVLSIVTALPVTVVGIELTPQQIINANFSTTKVSERQAVSSVTVNGTLRVDQQRLFRVAPVVDGIVTDLNAVAHSTVTKGQVLARLRSNTLGQAQADYLEALARYNVAESDFQRILKLRKDGVVAESRLLETESVYKTANAVLDQRRRALALAGLSDTQIKALIDRPDDIAYYPLLSPADGVLLDVSVESGQMLSAGEEAFRLADLSVLWADVHIPVALIGQIELGGEVAIHVAAYSGRRFTGQMRSVSGEVNMESQTVSGRVVVDNVHRLLRPGMYVQATIMGSAETGLMVPESAMFRSGNDNYLFKVTGPNSFEPVKVIVAQPRNGWMRIESGVTAGTEIVSAGVAELKSHWQYQGGE